MSTSPGNTLHETILLSLFLGQRAASHPGAVLGGGYRVLLLSSQPSWVQQTPQNHLVLVCAGSRFCCLPPNPAGAGTFLPGACPTWHVPREGCHHR